MNRIVRENYPVADLPEDLREGFAPGEMVTIILESPKKPPASEHVPSLDELFAIRRPPYRSMEEIVAEIRQDRDEWDD